MDPVSLSLMSIGSTSVALRRLAKKMEAERPHPAEFVSSRGGNKPRASILRALSDATIRPRRILPPVSAHLIARLSRFAADNGLFVGANVALDTVIAVTDDELATAALAKRRVDLLICDLQGAPVCGVELAPRGGPDFSDHLTVRAFTQAGIPLISLPEDCDWETAVVALDAAFNGGATDGQTAAVELPDPGQDRAIAAE